MEEDDLADGWFPESVAADYDTPGGANAPEVVVPMVDVLEDLADRGPVLEFAVGTARVEVTIGDMTTTRAAGQFSLVYLVFNTISNVTTQDGQVDVFCNAAAHLRRDGLFLIEVGVPDLRRLPPGQDTVPFTVAPGREGGGYLGFDQYDTATQQFTSNHVTVSADGHGRFRRIPFRYAWPAEMDLMARIAGLSLTYRWAGWDRSPFTAESTAHVSVWRKP